jgi:hypothetical protein
VTLNPIPDPISNAQKIDLEYIGSTPLAPDSSFDLYVKECLLDQVYIQFGMLLDFMHLGRLQRLRIKSLRAGGSQVTDRSKVVQVVPRTQVSITFSSVSVPSNTVSKKEGLSYKSVGGLKKQIEIIKEMVHLPLHEPERFTQFGESFVHFISVSILQKT